MLTVRPYAPKPRAVFYTARERIDVTAADLFRVNTRQALNAPTGQWDMLLTGRKVRGRSFLDRIAPMDYVEIEMARVPSAGGALTLVMRGFVDNVTETTTSGSRRVSVNGRNFGKLLIQFEIYYMTEIDPAASLIPQARLEVNFGIPGGILSPTQFVHLVGDQIIAPNLAALQAKNPKIPNLRYDVQVPDRFAVNGFTIQPFTGSVINLFMQYASQPWIETFVEDRPNGPTFVYRFAPLRNYSGARVGNYGSSAARVMIGLGDIETMSVGRSDNEVRNYYFTYPTYSLIDRDAFKGEGLDLRRNPYVDLASLKRYGFRPIEVSTTLIPSLAGEAADLSATAKPDTIALAAELNEWLWRAFEHNDQYLNGSITVKGGAEFRPGMEVVIKETGRALYVTGVAQSFDIEAGQYHTQLDVTRGRE